MEGERSFPEKGESLFFIGLARGALDLIAGRVDRGLDGFDVQRLVCDDDRFAPGVRRGDLFDGDCLADGVIDVRFAHAAHHAVDLQRGFIHQKDLSFMMMAAARVCAVRAASAAGAFALLFLPDQIDHDCGNDRQQNCRDHDRAKILCEPGKHEDHSLISSFAGEEARPQVRSAVLSEMDYLIFAVSLVASL